MELTDQEGNATSTGFAQAEAVYMKVMEWGTSTKIVALVFDTTASNSGHLRGAAIRLQGLLKCPLIFCGCRHHVGELLGKNTYHVIFGKDPAPDVKMFLNIKKFWSMVDTAAAPRLVDIPDEKERKELIELLTNLLVKENQKQDLFIRGDYRELCEITLVLLGGELPGGKKIVWKKPGATHKARFLAFGLCALKIWAFSNQQVVKDSCFTKRVRKKKPAEEQVPAKKGRPAAKKARPAATKARPAATKARQAATKARPAATKVPARRGRPVKKKVKPVKEREPETEPDTEPEPEIEIIFEEEKVELLKRYCVYAVKFYIPFFLTANIGADAAVNDLSLYKKLKKFQQVDKELADEALATLSRHLWYLVPNNVLFSLASNKLEDDDKSRIAARLMFLSKPNKIKFV